MQEYKVQTASISGTASRHRRRTADDFLAFCTMVLEYENYDVVKHEVRFLYIIIHDTQEVLFLFYAPLNSGMWLNQFSPSTLSFY